MVLTVACSTGGDDIPEIDNPNPEQGTGSVVTSVNALIGGYSRAAVVIESNGNYQGYWSKDDELFVTDMRNSALFTLSSGEGGTKGRFSGSLESQNKVLYALYPASEVSMNGTYFNYTIPVEQSYNPVRGANVKEKLLLFGKTIDGENFTMTNAAAVVRFDITLPADEVINSVTMTTEQTKIAGSCSMTIANPYANATGSNTITLSYPSKPKGKSSDGWATIAPVNFTNTTERVIYDIKTASGLYSFCYKPTEKFEVGGLYTIKLSVEEFAQIEDRDLIKDGEFYSSKGIPEPEPEPGSVAKGRILYNDGTPAVGVSVSDGFSVVQTDSKGCYTLTPHQDTWYIYYSLPAECAVTTNNFGLPCFFTKYSRDKFVYDFTLTRQKSGKDSNFTIFCLADPQCSSSANRARFVSESIPFLNSYAKEKGVPCFGITLGDIVSSGNSSDTTPQMPHMRGHMSKDKSGFPIFQTMGNHDYLYFNAAAPIEPDESSSTYNIKAQRLFEEIFGPINYSWNRGDAHII